VPSVHPILRLVVAQPQLLAEHVSAYALLLAEEGSSAAARVHRQVGARLILIACVAVSAALAGVALMLWATLAAGSIAQPWVLVAVPVLPLLPGAWAWAVAREVDSAGPFALLRGQLDADIALLHQVHAR